MKDKDYIKRTIRNYLAHEAVETEFDNRHPKETRPDWLDTYMTTTSYEEKNGAYIVSIVLEYKFQLAPNEYWEEDMLVHVDPVTGEKKIVICDGGIQIPPKIIFQAKVDLGRESGETFTAADINNWDLWKRFYSDISVTVMEEVNLDELERCDYRELYGGEFCGTFDIVIPSIPLPKCQVYMEWAGDASRVSQIHALKKLLPKIKEMDNSVLLEAARKGESFKLAEMYLSEGYDLVKRGKEMGLILCIVESDSEEIM